MDKKKRLLLIIGGCCVGALMQAEDLSLSVTASLSSQVLSMTHKNSYLASNILLACIALNFDGKGHILKSDAFQVLSKKTGGTQSQSLKNKSRFKPLTCLTAKLSESKSKESKCPTPKVIGRAISSKAVLDCPTPKIDSTGMGERVQSSKEMQKEGSFGKIPSVNSFGDIPNSCATPEIKKRKIFSADACASMAPAAAPTTSVAPSASVEEGFIIGDYSSPSASLGPAVTNLSSLLSPSHKNGEPTPYCPVSPVDKNSHS